MEGGAGNFGRNIGEGKMWQLNGELATLVGGRSRQLWWVGEAGNFGGWDDLGQL